MEVAMTIPVISTAKEMPPNGVLVLVCGGIAKRKTGEWFSGMNGRKLNWEPLWWAPIPGDNVDPIIERLADDSAKQSARIQKWSLRS